MPTKPRRHLLAPCIYIPPSLPVPTVHTCSESRTWNTPARVLPLRAVSQELETPSFRGFWELLASARTHTRTHTRPEILPHRLTFCHGQKVTDFLARVFLSWHIVRTFCQDKMSGGTWHFVRLNFGQFSGSVLTESAFGISVRFWRNQRSEFGCKNTAKRVL